MTTLADAIATPSGVGINAAIGRQAAATTRSVNLCNEDSANLAAIATNAASTAPSPVIGPGKWETVAASASAQILGGAGAIGDYVSHVLIVPATTSPGAVSIQDGAGSAITIFAGGASSVTNLVPFAVPLMMASIAGAWKLTTGANVSAIGVGLFT